MTVHALLSHINSQLLMVMQYLHPSFQRRQPNYSCQKTHFPPTSHPCFHFFLPLLNQMLKVLRKMTWNSKEETGAGDTK